MNILLDSHILLWALVNDKRLSDSAKLYIINPENYIYFSAVSIWELTMKHLLYPREIKFTTEELIDFAEEAGFEQLDLTPYDVTMLETLKRAPDAPKHKDPFDKMLICQAKAQGMLLLTHDELLPYYNERCIVSV